MQAHPELGLKLAGLKALASLRMEKGYRYYGVDVDNTDRILETGLGFTCDFEKPGGFIGDEAAKAGDNVDHRIPISCLARAVPLEWTRLDRVIRQGADDCHSHGCDPNGMGPPSSRHSAMATR